MKKLAKSYRAENSVEAYATCSCTCSGTCSSSSVTVATGIAHSISLGSSKK